MCLYGEKNRKTKKNNLKPPTNTKTKMIKGKERDNIKGEVM